MRPIFARLLAIYIVASAFSGPALGAPGLFDPAYRAVIPEGMDRFASLKSFGCGSDNKELARANVTATWTPTSAMLDDLENRLPDALRTAIDKSKIDPTRKILLTTWESIGNHARQYLGIAANGKNLILVIAAPIRFVDFDGPHDAIYLTDREWRTGMKPLGVCDGGPQEFSVLYDPSSATFGKFFFNGP